MRVVVPRSEPPGPDSFRWRPIFCRSALGWSGQAVRGGRRGTKLDAGLLFIMRSHSSDMALKGPVAPAQTSAGNMRRLVRLDLLILDVSNSG